MPESRVLTVRLNADLKCRLESLANRTKRSKSLLAAEAIAAYVDLNDWQIAEIEQGLEEADAGDVMSDDALAIARKRWTSWRPSGQ